MAYRITTFYNNINLVEELPEVFNQSVITSVLYNRNVSTELVNTALSSLYTRAKQVHAYARNHYTHGLPEGSVGQSAVPDSTIKEALCSDLDLTNDDVLLVNTEIYEFSIQEFVVQWLIDNTNFQWYSDLLTTEITLNDDTEYNYTYNGSRVVSDNSFVITFKRVSLYVEEYTTRTVVLDTAFNTSSTHYYITYEHLQDKPRIWIYDTSTGLYPDLVSKEVIFGETWYMPIVPLRVFDDDYFQDKYKENPLYKTSTTLLGKLDLDVQDLRESLNENPDIGEIDHAYVTFAASLDSKEEAVDSYLWHYFDQLAIHSYVTRQDVEDSIENWKNQVLYSIPSLPRQTLRIVEHTYDFSYGFHFIETSIINKVIGKIGTVTKQIITHHEDIWVKVNHPMSYAILQNPSNGLLLTRQVTATECKTVFVSNPTQSNMIAGAESYYSDIYNSDKLNELIIPINLDTLSLMPFREANKVCYDSLKLVINSFKKEKVKWYEKGFFKLIVIVVTTVISVAIGFSDGGSLMSGLLAATTTAAGIGAVVLTVMQNIFISILFEASFKLVEDAISVEVLYALATIAMVYGTISTSFDLGLPYADKFVGFSTMSLEQINRIAMEEVQTDLAEFTSYSENKLEELEELKSELGLDSNTFPMVELFLGVGMLPREKPSEFIHRKTQVDFISVMLDEIPNFVDTKLYLPKGYE